MAGAFERAVEWIKGEIESGKPISTIMLTMPTFRDEELVVNKIYSFNPLIIGYEDQELNIELDSKIILKVNWIAKNLGMNIVVSPPDIHILRENVPIGVVRRNGFGASDPALLSELARQFGHVVTHQEVDIEVKDSWIMSTKILFRHLRSRKLLYTIFFFILIPTAIALFISLNYPSILGGGLVALSMPIIVFLATAIITYLYMRRKSEISRINIKSFYNDSSGGRVKGE